MMVHRELRIEPPADQLAAARAWLEPVRTALGVEFVGAYLTGGVLAQGFDPEQSKINLLVVARTMDGDTMERVRTAIPITRKPPHFDPLFLTRRQVEHSLDSFPIEVLEFRERHLCIEGDDFLPGLEVPLHFLRLQCEHELRGKLIQVRQAYLLSARNPEDLVEVLRRAASSYATLFRTLLRLRGESPPANPAQVIGRIASLFRLDAEALLGAHMVRYSTKKYRPEEILTIYRRFLVEVNRLVIAIDALQVPQGHPTS
jgi:hypothetical protein